MNIRMVNHEGFLWNCVTINGVTYLLRKLGPIGSCVRP